MKHIIAELAVIFLLICNSVVYAQGDPLANLIVKNGRITGSLEVCIDGDTGRFDTILVDSPLPAQVYSRDIFVMEYRRFSKKEVQKALREIGQSEQGNFVSDGKGFRFTGAMRIDPAADITWEAAAEQAVRIGHSFFRALGIEVAAESAYVTRPYDEEAFICAEKERLIHQCSEIDEQIERQRAQWKRMQKYETRGPQYTRVSFHIMTDGMRVASWPAYPAGFSDEPNAMVAFDTGVSVLVSDSGVLVEAQVGHVPQVKGRKTPQDDAVIAKQLEQSHIRAESWQEALDQAQRINQLPKNCAETSNKSEYADEPITWYASQAVVTEIHPCLYTISKDEWVMIWRIESMQQYADGCRF